MKNFLLALFILVSTVTVRAQFDEQFYHPGKEISEPVDLQYYEIFSRAEGDTLHSIFITPQGSPKATVLFFHGNGLNLWQAVYNVRPLVANGYNVMMWDYRGFGKSSGTPTHANIAVDAQAVFDILMETEEAEGLPVILYGSSIGGQSATLVANNNRERVHGLVLDGAAKSFTSLALMSTPPEYHQAIKQFVTSPYSIEAGIADLEGVKILFIHSEQDFIPYDGATLLYEAAREPKKFWTYEGPHIRACEADPEEFVRNIDWLLE